MKSPRWPLWLWGLQALVPGFLLYFAAWRMALPDSVPADPVLTAAAATVGGTWMLLVAALLARRRGRAWLIARRRDWSLSAIVIVGCVVAGDAALTAFGIVKTVERQRAESIAFTLGTFTRHRLIPKEVVLADESRIHVNRRGYRGAEIAARKRDGQVRLVVLGGSQVFDFHNDWPAMMGAELRSRRHDVEVINAGVPHHDSADSLGKFLTDIWTLEPDIVFACSAWNDIKYFSWLTPEEPYARLPPTTPRSWRPDWRIYPSGLDRVLTVSAIYRHFRWGLGQLLYADEGGTLARRPAAPQSRIGGWGPRQYRLNLALAASLARQIGAELVLCKQARLLVAGGTGPSQDRARDYGLRNVRLPPEELIRALEACDRIVEEVATESSLAVIDMHAVLSGRPEIFSDAIHFSRAGAREAALLAAGALEPVVARRLAREVRP